MQSVYLDLLVFVTKVAIGCTIFICPLRFAYRRLSRNHGVLWVLFVFAFCAASPVVLLELDQIFTGKIIFVSAVFGAIAMLTFEPAEKSLTKPQVMGLVAMPVGFLVASLFLSTANLGARG